MGEVLDHSRSSDNKMPTLQRLPLLIQGDLVCVRILIFILLVFATIGAVSHSKAA
jgi:hypothetical protein